MTVNKILDMCLNKNYYLVIKSSEGKILFNEGENDKIKEALKYSYSHVKSFEINFMGTKLDRLVITLEQTK